MKFKTGGYIDEKTLNKEEVKIFYSFLISERERHQKEYEKYHSIAESDDMDSFMRVLALTAEHRHAKDIRHIDQTIKYLNDSCLL